MIIFSCEKYLRHFLNLYLLSTYLKMLSLNTFIKVENERIV